MDSSTAISSPRTSSYIPQGTSCSPILTCPNVLPNPEFLMLWWEPPNFRYRFVPQWPLPDSTFSAWKDPAINHYNIPPEKSDYQRNRHQHCSGRLPNKLFCWYWGIYCSGSYPQQWSFSQCWLVDPWHPSLWDAGFFSDFYFYWNK